MTPCELETKEVYKFQWNILVIRESGGTRNQEQSEYEAYYLFNWPLNVGQVKMINSPRSSKILKFA